MKHLLWKLRFWWSMRWFRRNRERVRNIAAWAVGHQAKGGAHDCNTILSGSADRRIWEAANGRVV